MVAHLRNLIERLENATGPDRELDFAIAVACGFTVRQQATVYGSTKVAVDPSRKGRGNGAVDSRYTASLDAVVALVERVLPGCNAVIGWGEPHRNPWARLAPLSDGGRHPFDAGGATPAIALCLALLRASQAKEEQG